MTIQLPEYLERSILATVHGGRDASMDDAMAEAAPMLVQPLKHEQALSSPETKAAAPPTHKPL